MGILEFHLCETLAAPKLVSVKVQTASATVFLYATNIDVVAQCRCDNMLLILVRVHVYWTLGVRKMTSFEVKKETVSSHPYNNEVSWKKQSVIRLPLH